MFSRLLANGLAAALLLTADVAAQDMKARERANEPYAAGMMQMQQEAFADAVRSFQTAVGIDPAFEMAYYMMGRAQMGQRNYAAAVIALEKARNLFVAQGTQQFTTKQERQHVLRQRIDEYDRLSNELQEAATRPENKTRAESLNEQARQYQERKRQVQDMMRNEEAMSTQAVPGFVSLSLGSAYFRSDRIADAERAYLAAVATDPKIGEAHNNLAVIYMETGRLDAAEKAVEAAERAGRRVSPALKEEIKKRRKS
jgi:tetratricopeptide (TPR) repeat protein